MKILVVTPSYWPATDLGGPIFSLHNLNKALVKKGIDLTVYTTNVRLKGKVVPGRETLVDGVKVTYFSFSSFFEFLNPTGWQFSVPMREALERNIKNFDLVYILSVWNYPVIMATSICGRYNKPYVISPRGLLYPETFGKKPARKWLYYKLLIERKLGGASAVHYTSHDEAQSFHGRLGLKNKAIVAPNGIDLSEFSDLPDKNEFRKKYPALDGKTIILFLGRITWKKGIDILVRAFGILCKERPDLSLVIAGGDDEGYKKKVVSIVDKLGIGDRVIFTGALNGREKLEAYAGSDIFVLPSYSENFGMTVIEAMACGLPVVISDKVGICREAKGKNCAIVVEPNTESVYNGLSKLLDDERLKKDMAESGRSFVNESYNIDKVADKMIEEFEKLLIKNSSVM